MRNGGWHGFRKTNPAHFDSATRKRGDTAADPDPGRDRMRMVTRTAPRPRSFTTSRNRIHLDAPEIWVPDGWFSPRPGIKVRELFSSDDGYRISLVRYAPGARVPEHYHTADEHAFVLEGSILDGAGETGCGAYLMRPMGSRHRVWSERGALVLVHRLGPIRFLPGWIPGPAAPPEALGFPGNRPPVTLATGVEGAPWEDFRPGVRILPLFEGHPGNYKSAMLRYRPGASLPAHLHLGDEHVYVLTGGQEDEAGAYDSGAYLYNPTGTTHRVWSEEGCLTLVHWRAPERYL